MMMMMNDDDDDDDDDDAAGSETGQIEQIFSNQTASAYLQKPSPKHSQGQPQVSHWR